MVGEEELEEGALADAGGPRDDEGAEEVRCRRHGRAGSGEQGEGQTGKAWRRRTARLSPTPSDGRLGRGRIRGGRW